MSSLIISIVNLVVSFSLINIAKNVYLGIEVKTEDLLFGFKHFERAICINLLTSLYIILWCLIPIVGPFIAISKAYSYSMAAYIALDNPNMGYNDCISKSIEMMDGNKWNLFCLSISYIGWHILSAFTFEVCLGAYLFAICSA